MEFKYKKIFLLGFGFFAVSITWSVYNSFMPILLSRFTKNALLIGFIMTIDNYLALFIQPAVGTLSDHVDTKIGRRMPFLLIGMPIASIFLFLIPSYTGFISLIVFLICMNLAMSIFRSPVISLMPDLTPKELRSKSNSIINIMGGIGAIMAYLLGSELWKANEGYPFYMCGILMIISLIILFSNIHEKEDALYFTKEKEEKSAEDTYDGHNKKSLIFLLAAICCYFIAYQGVETFFTMYGTQYLKLSVPAAARSFFFISISFLLFAYPAGLIGTKLGKKKTMMAGILGLFIFFLALSFTKNIIIIRAVFVVCGFMWALININAYPFVVQMASGSKTGAYTGYYYLVSSIAAIVSPPLLGELINVFTYRCMFIYSFIFFLISYLLIRMVKED